MQYRREIDGLRAVAVLPVILFHAGFSVFSGGYVGVDVFFVISGYLITTILIAEREAGTYSIWSFYERRARRILPALFVVMAFCLCIAWLHMPPFLFEDFARSMAFASLFASNVHFLEFTGYFEGETELQPLLHTWSLAVEEQFYLLFPLLLLALSQFHRGRYLFVFGLLALVSLGVSEWGWRNYPEQNFFFTPSRFWELLAGSFCAVLMFRRDIAGSEFLAALGLGLIIYAVVWFDSSVPFPSLFTLVPVLGSVLVILYARPGTWTGGILGWPVFVGIGLVSYSAYLWHQPLFAFARILTNDSAGTGLLASLAACSLGLAYLTWRFVEQPFRHKPIPVMPRRSHVFAASLTGILVFATFGFWGFGNGGFPSRLNLEITPEFTRVLNSFEQRADHGACFRGSDSTKKYAKLCNLHKVDDPEYAFGLIGDSHAVAMMPALEHISDKFNANILAAAVPACPPLLGVLSENRHVNRDFCKSSVEEQIHDLIEAEVDVVMLVSRWTLYAGDSYEGEDTEFALTLQGGRKAEDAASALTALDQGVEATLEKLTSAGVHVVLVAQVPAQTVRPRQVFERVLLRGASLNVARELISDSFVKAPSHDAIQSRVRQMLQSHNSSDVTTIVLDDVFHVDGRFAWYIEDEVLYSDDDHLSVAGARRAAPRLGDQLEAILDGL